MISDETFPVEYEDDDLDAAGQASSGSTTLTTATGGESTIDWSKPNIGSTSCEVSQPDYDTTTTSHSFASTTLNCTEKDVQPLPLILPRAPSKKRISFSMQDLYSGHPGPRRNTYSHVQSKVKQQIRENAARHKPISRHKSMMISYQGSQSAGDESMIYDYESAEKHELVQELKQKSSRIIELVGKCDAADNKLTELEERCDEKDSRIYSLEFDRSRMRLAFDKLRHELQEHKEKEAQYKRQLAMSPPPLRNLRNCATQTYVDQEPQNPMVRELKFKDEDDDSTLMDNTHFSDMNNASSDHLIPPITPEIHMMDEIALDESGVPKPHEVNIDAEVTRRKGKKKAMKRGFLRIFACVAAQSGGN